MWPYVKFMASCFSDSSSHSSPTIPDIHTHHLVPMQLQAFPLIGGKAWKQGYCKQSTPICTNSYVSSPSVPSFPTSVWLHCQLSMNTRRSEWQDGRTIEATVIHTVHLVYKMHDCMYSTILSFWYYTGANTRCNEQNSTKHYRGHYLLALDVISFN